MSSERYDACREFTLGYAACLAIQHRDVIGQSIHWLAGWDAAWPARQEKNRQLDLYLVSIGQEPQMEIILAGTTPSQWVTHDKISRDLHKGDIWWHDNGEQIFPVNLMWCPTGEYFFASLGQWGWTRSQPVSEMRGLWMPCIEPEPNKEYRENWIGE